MISVSIREPESEDEKAFLSAMQRSRALHEPWVKVPLTSDEYKEYLIRFQQVNHKSYLVCDATGKIAGVFNISEIVKGMFQSAYLAYYGVMDFVGKGYMDAGLKLVLVKAFTELGLHRLEANIQPDNLPSINLVKRNGFRKEGFSPRYLKVSGEWKDHERWAITYEDWQDYHTVKHF